MKEKKKPCSVFCIFTEKEKDCIKHTAYKEDDFVFVRACQCSLNLAQIIHKLKSTGLASIIGGVL